MPVKARGSRLGAVPGHRPALLGDYPRPALRLVGGAPPPGPWAPGPAPLQYGVDYSFAARRGRDPVRWRRGSPITVRLTGAGGLAGESGPAAALAAVVTELRALGCPGLVIGKFSPALFDPDDVPEQEIHVAYLTARALAAVAAGQPGRPGIGGATASPDGSCYVAGYAAVNADLAGPRPAAGPALTVLRHVLGHALGLGHAARRGLVMSSQPPAAATGYGRGDRYALARLGQAAPQRR